MSMIFNMEIKVGDDEVVGEGEMDVAMENEGDVEDDEKNAFRC